MTTLRLPLMRKPQPFDAITIDVRGGTISFTDHGVPVLTEEVNMGNPADLGQITLMGFCGIVLGRDNDQAKAGAPMTDQTSTDADARLAFERLVRL